jgi:hypothetical protein
MGHSVMCRGRCDVVLMRGISRLLLCSRCVKKGSLARALGGTRALLARGFFDGNVLLGSGSSQQR